jgi:outer membrane protein assembly factor BamB
MVGYSLAVAGGVVYVDSLDCKVYAIDASTGAQVWNYTTGNKMVSSPAVDGGVVYVGSFDDKVYALDASTGALMWSYTTGRSVQCSPAVSDGMVYVGSDDQNVYAFGSYHDVAIAGVEISSKVAYQGDNVTVSVQAFDSGTFPETFNVTAYADENTTVIGDEITIGTQTVSLSGRETADLGFAWDTTGVPLGIYTISAVASNVTGETDLTNNLYVDGQVELLSPVNGSDFDITMPTVLTVNPSIFTYDGTYQARL